MEGLNSHDFYMEMLYETNFGFAQKEQSQKTINYAQTRTCYARLLLEATTMAA